MCSLGAKRRTDRLVASAALMAADPAASTPDQTRTWAACQGFYRLLDHPEVTAEAISAPHFDQTRHPEPGVYLVVADTTEIQFPCESEVQGLRVLQILHNKPIQTVRDAVHQRPN